MAKTGAPAGYADYCEMLERERPDITVFASREIGDHCELVTTAGEFDTRVYVEKLNRRHPGRGRPHGRGGQEQRQAGARVTLPLAAAGNPFDSWRP